MARFPIAFAALALLMGATLAQAQGPTQPAAPARINLTLEQEHVIKELIKDLKIEPASASVKLTVGEAVPQGLVVQPVPVEIGQKVPQIKSHQFVVVGDQIAIVDPKDRKVVDLIGLKS